MSGYNFDSKSSSSSEATRILQRPSQSYHLSQLRALDRAKTRDNMQAEKSCASCSHFTQSCKCKMKGNKQVKSYNICQYHVLTQQG